jgi:hypothetical protein
MSVAHWIARPAATDPAKCVLSASLRIEISRIALRSEARPGAGIPCIYEAFLDLTLSTPDHPDQSRQGGGHWFEPSIAHHRISRHSVRTGLAALEAR